MRIPEVGSVSTAPEEKRMAAAISRLPSIRTLAGFFSVTKREAMTILYPSFIFSRMGAMYLWGTIPNAQVEYVTSLNLWLIDSMPLDNHSDGMTMYDALEQTEKNNIYLLFGINEIRSNEDYFESWAFEQYQSLLTMLREKNPNVNIYILSTYHPRSISGLPEPSLTEHLQWVNSRLARLADMNYVYYLDLDNGMTDEEGLIKEEYVGDGLHFGPTGTHALEDYIRTHVVRRNTYVKEICE